MCRVKCNGCVALGGWTSGWGNVAVLRFFGSLELETVHWLKFSDGPILEVDGFGDISYHFRIISGVLNVCR